MDLEAVPLPIPDRATALPILEVVRPVAVPLRLAVAALTIKNRFLPDRAQAAVPAVLPLDPVREAVLHQQVEALLQVDHPVPEAVLLHQVQAPVQAVVLLAVLPVRVVHLPDRRAQVDPPVRELPMMVVLATV